MVKIFNSTIIITNKCNLRCVYCYEKQAGNSFLGEDISEDVLIKGFEFLLRHTDTNGSVYSNAREYNNSDLLSVYLWGGEPTLRPDLIKLSVNIGNSIAKKYNKRIKWRISTNGVLINEEILDIIKDFEIYLSVDDNNIVQRKTRGCSSEYLKKGIWDKILKDSYVVTRIVNHPKYARGILIDQVKSLMDLGFTRFYPSTASGYGWPEEEFKILEEDYKVLTKWHFEKKIKIPNLDEYFSESSEDTDTAIWTGDKTAVCVSSDGKVYPSDLESYLNVSNIGNVVNGIDEKSLEKATQERSHIVDKNDVCGKCIAKKYCPGYGPVVYYNNLGKKIPYYYQDCCREYLAKIRCWYRIKNGKEPVNADYSRLVDVNR